MPVTNQASGNQKQKRDWLIYTECRRGFISTRFEVLVTGEVTTKYLKIRKEYYLTLKVSSFIFHLLLFLLYQIIILILKCLITQWVLLLVFTNNHFYFYLILFVCFSFHSFKWGFAVCSFFVLFTAFLGHFQPCSFFMSKKSLYTLSQQSNSFQ